METSFGIADYAVFITMLIISGGIGVYYRFSGGKQKTTNEYLFGNKNQSVINVAFSLMTNFMSAITLMGLSAENITYGTQFVVINISYILGTYIVSQVFLPVFYKLGALSVYESLLMYAAIFAVIIMAAVNVGGIGEIWNIAERNGRIELFNFSLDPTVRHSWFSLTLGGIFIYCSLYGINQTQVQRYLTVKDYKTAERPHFQH
uniref:Sodium-dependent multivitamin transporter n=1 Tax=Cacopsylla melanoneura TaxID=428564 RepID=A0A8D8UYJ2_9HEMI